jgi:hypothetical protein
MKEAENSLAGRIDSNTISGEIPKAEAPLLRGKFTQGGLALGPEGGECDADFLQTWRHGHSKSKSSRTQYRNSPESFYTTEELSIETQQA